MEIVKLPTWADNVLVNLNVSRVDLVTAGANSEAHIKLLKSKKEGGTGEMTMQEILGAMKPEHREIVEKALSEKDTAIKDLEKSKSDLEVDLKKAQKDAEEAITKSKTEPTEEDILKGASPEIRAIIEKERNKAAAAELVVKKQKEAAFNAECIAKAKSVSAVGTAEDDLVTVLKSLNEDQVESVMGILTAANKIIADGDVFKSQGSDGSPSDGGSEEAWNQIEKKAEEIQKSKGITKEAAIAEAVDQNPSLYKQYLGE